jgi:hypothetical protein
MKRLSENRTASYTVIFGVCLLVLILFVEAISNCVGWKLDYGTPKAQFEAIDLTAKGADFVGDKISVRGKVERIDVSDPKSAKVYLEGGIACDFGKFNSMAEGNAVGEVAFVSGILKRHEAGDHLLSPAIGRDPKAPFVPE